MGYQFDFSAVLTTEYVVRIGEGLLLTVLLSACALCLAVVLGLVLAMMRMSRFRLLKALVAIFVEVHQNVPLLIHILFWYFAIPELLPIPVRDAINASNGEFILSMMAIGFLFSAYFSEAFRSGIRAIPTVQYESGRALGFSFLQTFRYIIVPEAFRHALPSLVNLTLLLFKNTSLAAAVGVNELTNVTRSIESVTFRTFEIFTVATVLYLIVSGLIVLGGALLEARMRDLYQVRGGR
jgi:polar amino acid transport system permease protein